MLRAKDIIKEAYASDICVLENQKELVNLAAKVCILHEAKIELLKQHISLNQIPKFTPLVVASSGTGKTYVLQNIISKYFYTVLIDASSVTPPGYKGKNLADILYDAIQSVPNDNEKGIVVIIDEFDKVVETPYAENINAVSAQPSFLKLLENGTISIRDTTIDCSDFSFILCGAFTKMKEKYENDNKKIIGFSSNSKDDLKKDAQVISKENIIDYGIKPEIANRISNILYVPPLNQKCYEALLDSNCGASLLNKQRHIFGLLGSEFSINNDAKNKIIEMVMNSNSGGRAIEGIISKYATEALINISNNRRINKVIFEVKNDEIVFTYLTGKKSTPEYLYKKHYDENISLDLVDIIKNENNVMSFSTFLIDNCAFNEQYEKFKDQLKEYLIYNLLSLMIFNGDHITFNDLIDVESNIKRLRNVKNEFLTELNDLFENEEKEFMINLNNKFIYFLIETDDENTRKSLSHMLDMLIGNCNPKDYKVCKTSKHINENEQII